MFTAILDAALNFTASLISLFAAVFQGDIPGILNGIPNVFAAAFNGARAVAEAALNGILGLVQSIVSAISSISFSRLTSAASSASAAVSGAVSGIGGHAEGGIYPRGAHLTWFAEDSAEAAIPIDGSKNALNLWTRTGEMLGILSTKSNQSTKASTRARSTSIFSQPFGLGDFKMPPIKITTPGLPKPSGSKGSDGQTVKADEKKPSFLQKVWNELIGLMQGDGGSSYTRASETARRSTTTNSRAIGLTRRSTSIFNQPYGLPTMPLAMPTTIPVMNERGGLLESRLIESDRLEEKARSYETGSVPITLNFTFNGNVNKEEMKAGVREMMPTFEEQMARYQHERSRRAF